MYLAVVMCHSLPTAHSQERRTRALHTQGRGSSAHADVGLTASSESGTGHVLKLRVAAVSKEPSKFESVMLEEVVDKLQMVQGG